MHSPVVAELRAETTVNHAERDALVRVNLQLTRALAITREKINASKKSLLAMPKKGSGRDPDDGTRGRTPRAR